MAVEKLTKYRNDITYQRIWFKIYIYTVQNQRARTQHRNKKKYMHIYTVDMNKGLCTFEIT